MIYWNVLFSSVSAFNVRFLKDLIPSVSYRRAVDATITVTPNVPGYYDYLFTNIVFNPLTLFANLTLRYDSGPEVIVTHLRLLYADSRLFWTFLLCRGQYWSFWKTNPIDNWITRPLKSIVNSISLANSCCILCYKLVTVNGERELNHYHNVAIK